MKKKRVIFLPIWGKENETIPVKQMEAIRKMGVEASYGLPGGFFPLTRSCFQFRPDLISLDWIHQYALTPRLTSSIIKSTAFFLDVWIAVLFFRVKLVWTIHNLHHHDDRPRRLEHWISSFFAKRCERIRVLGPGIKLLVAKHFHTDLNKIEEIPEGSYVGWYPEGISKILSRDRLQIGQEERVWLYFGNLRPYKGVENLIDAFESLALPNHRLLIAGRPYDQSYAQELKNRVGENALISLHFKTIPDDELQVFFGAADIVVLPFKNVLNSGSAILAMGFSKPVVAPAIGLLPFRLQRQPNLLFDSRKDLIEILKETTKLDSSELEEIGRLNKEFALSFHWSDFAQMIVRVLDHE